MKYILKTLLIIALFPLISFSQIEQKGIPDYYPETKIEIPTLILPPVDSKKIESIDKEIESSRLKRMRYAEILDVDINPDYDGMWVSKNSGEKVWYLKIYSTGAYSLGVLFDHYRLPKGAKLFVYSEDKEHVRGAFTYKNNKANYMLPVAPVKGDAIVIEYHEPANADFKGELHIRSVAHDYKNILGYFSNVTKGFGDSGGCNINVNCDDDELWQLLKQSVCKITYNGWVCSGSLMNNTKQDETPYLLTANHCINNDYDASIATFYFNYESDSCVNLDGPTDQTIAGATLISTPPQETVDFSLLELSVKPPPGYNPYYAGWNRDIANPAKVVSIHHPSGDIKKITKSFNGATTGDYGDGYDPFKHWWIDEWDEGTTEGGSSGSPLFNQKGQVIGDLTGGDASCNYNFNDYYQQVYHSWEDFENPDQQLKPWLDPLNSEVVELNGFLPYDTIPSNLTAQLNDTIVELKWNEVVDTPNVASYYVYLNDIKIDSVNSTWYSDTLNKNTQLYTYYVTAKYNSPQEYESIPSNFAYVRTYNPSVLPYTETFEDTSIVYHYWYQERANDSVGWKIKSGGNEVVLDAAFEGGLNAYFYGDSVKSAKFVLPKFDLSGYTHVNLSFYVHMQEFNNKVHQLNILYKEADTIPWKTVRSFHYNVNTWQKKEISLPDLTDNYQVAFEGVGMGGFGIAIDSIAIKEDLNFIDVAFQLDADTICQQDSIRFITNVDNSNEIYWNFGNTADPQEVFGQGPHWVKYRTTGIKPLQLIVNDTYLKSDHQVVVVYENPSKPIFANTQNELISSAEYGNQWYLDGNPIEGATDNTFVIIQDGYYSVEVTNSFGCTAISDSKYIIVDDVEDFKGVVMENEIKVFPNPNKGSFYLEIETTEKQNYDYRIIDITGRVVVSGTLDNTKKQRIQLKNPNEGVYFIQVQSEHTYYTSKLLIKK